MIWASGQQRSVNKSKTDRSPASLWGWITLRPCVTSTSPHWHSTSLLISCKGLRRGERWIIQGEHNENTNIENRSVAINDVYVLLWILCPLMAISNTNTYCSYLIFKQPLTDSAVRHLWWTRHLVWLSETSIKDILPRHTLAERN